MVCASKKSAVPEGEQAEARTGRFFSNGAVPEVDVHGVKAGEHSAEFSGPMAIIVERPMAESMEYAAAGPSPEAEHVFGVEWPEVSRPASRWLRWRRSVLAMADSSPPKRQRATRRRRGEGVGHRLLRGEGLGGDEEERLFGAEVADGFGEVRAVDVGDEAER